MAASKDDVLAAAKEAIRRAAMPQILSGALARYMMDFSYTTRMAGVDEPRSMNDLQLQNKIIEATDRALERAGPP